ncbi:SusC/RagA family TonB-linked outer membrane protein [Pseudobacter ginsenosidimutans]|uniref:TonB-linked SusC/RagA family outer membrane protein n=1 Tax=Pseudobacter ginsenosidimutans TaxID=661488 RepID=A0A4Q7N168_9BACT|nr:SusC/RagA family TonB-linked outer membrane protein [Pseudobacter ginsenosidimutans]QEC43682.1 SusC/RagA family TonB-linked outer membrane protein [Pseudobacter ginsenosidimutans]RZS75083.1 TonB-linked SusC/RagA family outer membrane protein [Pseudobacter ginsenosidimutans]
MKRIVLFFIFVVLLQFIYSTGYGQKPVSLEAKEENLVTVLRSIQSQSGYSIIWVDKQMQIANKVTISLKAVSIQDALAKIFANQPLSYIIEEDGKRVIIQAKKKNAKQDQQGGRTVDIKGKVVNRQGEPIAGATISEQGADRYTASVADGTFILRDVDENAMLLISSIGYETKTVKAGGSGSLRVELTVAAMQMQEVTIVNTGYQQIGRERSTGSYEFIKKDDLNRQVGTNILNRLEGVSSSILFDRRNLSPGQNTISQNNLIIRGLSTLSEGMKAPLVVVNNFPYEGDINNINPSDVENITILKDAAAASIWGAKAANGVIVITTKKGQFNQPVRASFSANANTYEKPDLNYYPQMPVADFVEVEKYLFDQGFYNGILNSPVAPAVSPVVEILNNKRAGITNPAEADRLIEALKKEDVRNEFEKYIYRQPVLQQYALNLSGGTEKVRYLITGGLDQSPGVLKGDQMRRITFRTDNTFVLTDKLDLQLGVAYANTKTENNSMGEYGDENYNYRGGAMFIYPYARFVGDDGNQLTFPKNYREGYTDTAGNGQLLDWKYRPLDELELNPRTINTQDITANLEAKFKINRNINLTFRYQYEQSNIDSRSLNKAESYFSRNTVNLFTEIIDGQVIRRVPEGGILRLFNQKLVAQSANIQANFNKTWAQKHNLFAIAGGEIRNAVMNQNNSITYGYLESNSSVANVDYVTPFPRYGNRGEAQIPPGYSINKLTDRFVSLLANAAYTYDGRYILSASFRRDASNLFGVSTNNKWKPFWSVGGSWNLSKENFYDFDLLPFLQFNATYGVQGNANNTISPYTIIQFEGAQYSIINQPYANINTPGNPELSWEKTRQLNLRLEFQSAGNKLTGRFEMYRKNSIDLIYNSTIDPTNGIGSVARNSASMLTKGFEAELNYKALDREVKWVMGLSLNTIQNKVTDYLLEDKDRSLSGIINSSGAGIIPVRGLQPYSILSFPFAGLDPQTGNPRGWLGKEISSNYFEINRQSIDTGSMVRHGSAIPTVFGNFRHTISYKNISLHFSIAYRLGYYFRKRAISYNELVSSGLGQVDYVNRWQKPGDETMTTVPSFLYPDDSYGARDLFYAQSSVNVLKGDNIQLQNVNLQYTLGKNKLPFKFMRSFSVFVAANNLGYIWRANDQKLDPDVPFAFYPRLRSYAAGATVEF